MISPLHPNISFHILHTLLYTRTNKANLFNNQEHLKSLIISIILMTFIFDSRVIGKKKLEANLRG